MSGITLLNSGVYTCYAFKSKDQYDNHFKIVSESSIKLEVEPSENRDGLIGINACSSINHVPWTLGLIFVVVIGSAVSSYIYARKKSKILKPNNK